MPLNSWLKLRTHFGVSALQVYLYPNTYVPISSACILMHMSNHLHKKLFPNVTDNTYYYNEYIQLPVIRLFTNQST